ncbi:phage portal protein [Ligilactobacillus apodemi]|uniref:phage portal protein n=1 Tax=Ligilactobacillus apodemi TaxID=307126 RepID=UPI00214C392D|nr:phage portal protein [Ligilactobacillus apodemi]MCR1902301.1 phage portal protein [Ligilactobacillus apodemi]
MNIVDRLKILFRKGGVKVGMVKQLNKITDDERIAISQSEYDRIDKNLKFYQNKFPKVEFVNSNGVKKHRPFYGSELDKKACERLASILFNEQCEVTSKDATANTFLVDVLQKNHFNQIFEEKLETAIALGGVAARPYVDEQNNIRIAWAYADQFYPLRNNTDRISEAAFVSKTIRTENDQLIYYTLLEFHEWTSPTSYKITNELYRSEHSDSVGMQVALDILYPEMQEEVEFDNIVKTPVFAYMKTPGANNKNLESPLGLGLADRALVQMKTINQIYDQFYREIKLGKRKIGIPEEFLRSEINYNADNSISEGMPMIFDADQDVYVKLRGDSANSGIQNLTADIRASQYHDSLDILLRSFEDHVGFSAGTFSLSSTGSIATATEVVSNNSKTYQTRSSYLTQVEGFIKDLCKAILQIASIGELFSDGKARYSGDIDAEIESHFDDGVFVDKDKQKDEERQDMVAGVMPKIQYLMRNYGLSEQEAKQWQEQILAETPEYSKNAQAEEPEEVE